nr:10920_t:CDS:2 [Entrophospora candida]
MSIMLIPSSKKRPGISIDEVLEAYPENSEPIQELKTQCFTSPIPWNNALKFPNKTIAEPPQRMAPSLLSIVHRRCNEFVQNFTDDIGFKLPQNLLHDGMWNETNEELANNILNNLIIRHDAWRNPAFESNFVEKLNKGAYVTNIILPAVRASLKGLHLWTSSFLSNLERQSSAGAVRRGSG